MCTLVYKTDIQIYDQISILGIWWKVKVRHAVSLRFGLKEGKRALNITKFGMHSYLPNGHLNIWSYFNSRKLVKQETLSCAFPKVALKGSEIDRNVTKVSMYYCLLKWVPKSTFKFQLWKSRQNCIFSTLVRQSLIKGQNSSKYHINRCPCLSLKWVSKSTLKFDFSENGKNATF